MRRPTKADLDQLIEELGCLEGAQLQKITQPTPEELLLQLRLPGETVHLLFSIAAGEERFHLLPQRPPSLPSPPAFCMLLRKRLNNARVLAFHAHPTDRIITMTCQRGGEQHTLIAELLPRHANLLLCEGTDHFVQSMRPLPIARGLRRNDPYIPPEAPAGKTSQPRPSLLAHLAEIVDEEDPAFQEGILARCPNHRLYAQYVSQQSAQTRLTRIKQMALKTRRQAHKKCQRLLTNLERDRKRCEQTLAREQDAELLKHNLHLIKRGDSEVSVVDYYDPDMVRRVITLDPKLSPQQNLQKLFQKIKRARKGLTVIAPRLDETELHLLSLEEEIETIEASKDLESLLEALPEQNEPQRTSRSKQQQKSQPFHEFHSRDGHRILVGRNSKANDTLTFRIARGNDLWLHARGVAGSHVIVPLQRNETPSQDLLLDAATLAAHYSKARNQTNIEIIHTQTKYIRKPKGAPAGLVTVQRDNNITLRLEPERLERLLNKTTPPPTPK